MKPRPPRQSWESPFHLWGPAWSAPEPRNLESLIASGMCSRSLADCMISLLENHASLLVYSSASSAGKSTLMEALLRELPSNRRIVYIRGCYEPFDFTDATDPSRTVLCINEFSPHLPVYVWGPAARTVFELTATGYQMLGTMHAQSSESLIQMLIRKPLHIPIDHISLPKILLQIDALEIDHTTHRAIQSVVGLLPDADTRSLRRLVLYEKSPDNAGDSVDVQAAGAFRLALERHCHQIPKSD